MFKTSIIFIISLVISFNTIAMTAFKADQDIKYSIGQSSVKIERSIKSLEEANRIKIVSNNENVITDIFIKDQGIPIDSISVGDPLEKVYEVYPKTWISKYKDKIVVLKGKSTHYGIATEYIIFLTQDYKTVSEIQLGDTASFVRKNLVDSNNKAKQLLQGKWKSEHQRTLEFREENLEDSQLDALYESQKYIVISPNQMFIYRMRGNTSDKVKIRFWITEDSLYIFSIDTLGIPIKESIEVFKRVP